MAYLAIQIEGKTPTRRSLDAAKPMILGRSMESDLWLDDSRLSRQHCRIERATGGEWTIADLASKNGTFVNGERISFHKLREDDEIVVGRATMVFHTGVMPASRPKDPTAAAKLSDTAVAPAMSPHDTLIDSRVGLPGMPSPQPRPMPRDDDPGAPHRPLPFRRDRPQPQPDDVPKGGWLRALFRRRR